MSLDDSKIAVGYEPSASSNAVVRYRPLPRGLVGWFLAIVGVVVMWVVLWSLWATVTINRLSVDSVRTRQYDKHVSDKRLHHDRFDEVEDELYVIRERLLKLEHASELKKATERANP